MRKAALLSLLFVISPALFATDFVCAGTGSRNWHNAADWMPAGIPGAGDTATIGTGCSMECEAGTSCVLGKASTGAGTVDLKIAWGGSLTVRSGANFDMQGDVSLLGELDVFGGTFALDPGVAGSAAYYIDGGSSAGAHTLKICSEQTCSSSAAPLAILTCNAGTSGTCQIRHTSGAGNSLNVLGSHGQISYFGSAGVAAVTLVDGTQPTAGGFVLKNNFSLHSNGVIRVEYDNPALDLTFDGVAFDTLVDVSASSGGYSFLDLISINPPASGDRTFRATCANTGNRTGQIFLNVVNPTVGDDTHPGLVAYNCSLAKSAKGGTFQNVLSVIDRNNSSGTALMTARNTDATFKNWVMLNHTNNQHHLLGTGFDAGGTQNTYVHMTFDGDGYVSYDAGDDYQDGGNYSASGGLHINDSGTLFTLGANPSQIASIDHETIYDSFGGAICETQCTATMLAKVSNSLFVMPSAAAGSETGNNDGAHFASAYRYQYRQSAASSNTDYNFFWQMPGSGDPGANPAKNVYIQLNLGDTPSWAELTPQEADLVWHQAVTISGVNVTCTNCFANARAKDYVVDITRRPATYAVISQVTDASHAILYTSVPQYSPGDLIDVRPAYFASNGLYGVDWGSHDQHINPWLQDAGRTVCTWWKSQSGSPVNCNWPKANYYTAGVGTSSTTISDTTLDFQSIGIQDGLEVVLLYTPNYLVRGIATVLAHSSNSLTIAPPVPGAGQGDHYTFITAAQSLGQAAVQLYGFDVNGNQVTPPAWVNPAMVSNMANYLRQGLTPTNLALFGAGGDGKSIGAVESMPPSAAIMVSSF